jgi:hypothetical protein
MEIVLSVSMFFCGQGHTTSRAQRSRSDGTQYDDKNSSPTHEWNLIAKQKQAKKS